MHAPVALFVYNRPFHTRQTVEALQRNDLARETELVVVSDGPRTPAAAPAVREVRNYVRAIQGFRVVRVVERPTNLGLANSIIDGVTAVVRDRGRVIVLEDDLLTSPHFLRFMNAGLDLYEHDERVIGLHGYMYPLPVQLPETFFLRGADCWGWATWSRGWELFEPDGRKLLDEVRRRRLEGEFDLDGAYPYTRMLSDQVRGRNDSWAIRWHASAFLKGKLTLNSARSLVLNIGTDLSGTHCGSTRAFHVDLADTPIRLERIEVAECHAARDQIQAFHRKRHRSSFAARAVGRILRATKRMASA